MPQLDRARHRFSTRPLSSTDIGRNWDLFRALARWAGSPANLDNNVLAAAMAANEQFDQPLELAEVRGVAKSVEGKRRYWIAKGKFYTIEQRTLWGRERGIKSGEARREKNEDRDAAIVHAITEDGRPYREVAREFGLNVGAVHHIVKRDFQGPWAVEPTEEWRALKPLFEK